MSHTASLLRRSLLVVPALGVLLHLGSCGGNDDDSHAFVVLSTDGTVSGTSPIVVRGIFGVYFASEALTGAGGTVLNGDGDTLDQVPVLVTLTSPVERPTGVAARSAEILGDDLFLEVDEAEDGRDWNGGGLTDRVLLHYERVTDALTLLDTLAPGARRAALLVSGTRLYYTAAAAGLMGDETALRYIRIGAPFASVDVAGEAGGGTLTPGLLGEDDGLLFLLLDETVEGRALNGDGLADDDSVLALLDATDPQATVRNVGLALRDQDEPVDADPVAFGDYTVAFLVDEAAQGAGSLNDETTFANPILPAACPGPPDTDTSDRVLHFLRFADFEAGMDTPHNTGLAGTGRAIATRDGVATLTDEADVGCDLNGNGNVGEWIVRWTAIGLPVAPGIDPVELHAVDPLLPGGSMGLNALNDRLVAVIDEALDGRDLDGKVPDHRLVAWLDPAAGASATWSFRHQSPAPLVGTGIFEDVDGDGIGDPGRGASEPYAGASWMAPEARAGRLGITFLEEVPGANPLVGSINTNDRCSFRRKDNDVTDALPVWLDFEAGPTLDFDGIGYAVDPTNPGVEIGAFTAFFRVSEAADSVDYNGDNVLDDLVLVRNSLGACFPVVMSDASMVPGPAVFTDGLGGAMFLADETFSDQDFNDDGDRIDLVVRYFSF